MPINFFTENISFKLSDKAKIKKWIIKTIEEENYKPGDITIVFCNDEYLLTLNKDYLKHDTFTDIITFDYSEKVSGSKNPKSLILNPKSLISGDIFISIERVEENAKKFSKSFNDELNRVIIHGILHLCGYKDKTASAKETMRKKEDFYLDYLRNNF